MGDKINLEQQEMLVQLGQEFRNARDIFGLRQEDWARIFQVTPNTIAQWERGTLKASGANLRKIRHISRIVEDDRVVCVVREYLKYDDGVTVTAGILGMLFGIMEASGIGYQAVEVLVRSGSHLINAIKTLQNNITNEKPGSGGM